MSNRKVSPAALKVEALETRAVASVSSATLSGGVLSIRADNSVTDAVVNKVGNNLVVRDNAPAGNGFFLTAPTWQFRLSAVDRIEFTGGSKADTFVVNYSLPTVARGNDGNDYLESANVGDTLYGGEGSDTLVGYGGDDRLYGGDGKDVLKGMTGNDALYGGGVDSADELWGGDGRDRFLTQPGDKVKDGSDLTSPTGLDAELKFADSASASWSNREIEELDVAFQRLFDATGNNRLLKDSVSGDMLTITQENLTDANGYNVDPYQRREVSYSGPWWNRTEHINLRTVPRRIVIDEWDATSATENRSMVNTMVHEIGHNWDSVAEGSAKWGTFVGHSGWVQNPANTRGLTRGQFVNSAGRREFDDRGWWRSVNTSAAFASDYGRLRPVEDWSETWEWYFANGRSTSHPSGNATMNAKLRIVDQLVRGLR